MSYMQHPMYVFKDRDVMHFGDVVVPIEVFDVVALMRFAELREIHGGLSALAPHMLAVAKAYEGNVGADALRRLFNLPPMICTASDEVLAYERTVRER